MYLVGEEAKCFVQAGRWTMLLDHGALGIA